MEAFGVAWRMARCSLALAALGAVASGQEVLLTVDGDPFDSIAPLAGTGDITLDGVPDLLVASNTNSRVRVISGADGSTYLDVHHTILTAFGYSVDGAGDFDADGVLDFVAGAPVEDVGFYNAGGVHVYSGVDASEIAAMYGSFDGDQLGMWVAGLGDVNGDGYDDVGACGRWNKARIYGGPDGRLIRQHPGVLTRASIAGVGDMDGDGAADYVVGWPQDSTNGSWTGRATVFSGRDGSEIHTVYGDTPHQQNVTTGDHLGRSVAGVGDVNADGVPDFVAGAPGEIELWYGATQSTVRAYSGVDAAILWEWDGEEQTQSPAGGHFGFRVTGSGDVNGDGYDDIFAAAPNAYSQGAILVFSGRTGRLLWRVLEAPDSFRIEHHDPVGDIDGDDITDFAVGDPSDDSAGQATGRVTVYAGALGDAERYCDGAPNSFGPGAALELGGPISVGNNALRLLVSGAVPGQFGLYFYGPDMNQSPFGDGYLCIGGGFYRLGPPQTIAPDGTDERPLDFTLPPLDAGPGQIVPGDSWSFQHWYRDPAGSGGSGFNLSDALRIQFLP